MAGTATDHSAKTLVAESFPLTTSSVVDEVDVITPPSWARFLAIYALNLSRLGLSQSETMTTSSVLENTDEHSPIPATTWLSDRLMGGPYYVSSATASTAYFVKYYRTRP